MRVSYSPYMRQTFPHLVTGAMRVQGIGAEAEVSSQVDRALAIAMDRLQGGSEGGFDEIKAWRAAFSKMDLKPTQYRCASEAILRRLRKDGTLPRIHPIIDLCNALSASSAIPIAVFDRSMIAGALEVGPATGGERYLSFGGVVESPNVGEIVFKDEAGEVHARRWTNRQAKTSAVGPQSTEVLVVAEALHANAGADVTDLTKTLSEAVAKAWECAVEYRVFGVGDPGFEVASATGLRS